MGWGRELYFKSWDPGLIMKMQFELIISGKMTCPPCNFTSFPFCLLSGHGNFMVLHCNSSKGLQRTLICTTFVGKTQTLTPEFPKGPLNTFWRCAESKVSCAGRVRTVCLTLLAEVGAIFIPDVYKKHVKVVSRRTQARGRPGQRSRVVSLSTWVS